MLASIKEFQPGTKIVFGRGGIQKEGYTLNEEQSEQILKMIFCIDDTIGKACVFSIPDGKVIIIRRYDDVQKAPDSWDLS